MSQIAIPPASPPIALTIQGLHAAYRAATLTPIALCNALLERLGTEPHPEVWISQLAQQAILARADALSSALTHDPDAALQRYPLLGIPFAVKDNIDVAGLPTTAGCPAFAYQAGQSATVVERLLEAGAILIGKTNLDQFATGLVGTRSPYGVVPNPFDPRYISGGSSSGSAAAVAHGYVAFALGTDTAGSGRVPAGFCNLVGLKPTPGLISTQGVVPACKSLDCVSIFAHTTADAWQVLQAMAGPDAADAYQKPIPPLAPLLRQLKIGVPATPEHFGDPIAQAAFQRALDTLRSDPRVVMTPLALDAFHAVADLLYDGPWVAERRAAIGDFFDAHQIDIDPAVFSVIGRANGKSAVDAFQGLYRLEAGKRMAEAVFGDIDLLLVPTAPRPYTLAEIAEQPIERNSHLGRYTNFVNLLGLSALALPAGFRSDGLPCGITLIAPGGGDHRLAEFARSIEPLLHQRLGTSDAEPPRCKDVLPPLPAAEATIDVVVIGAHLSGLPLNWQLRERSATLKAVTHTAPTYRFFALPGTVPPKPGLLRVAEGGASIAVEVWTMPLRHFGSFVGEIPPPLGIGTIQLASGEEAKGFLCEPLALEGATDITEHGGWRAYLARQQTATPPQ